MSKNFFRCNNCLFPSTKPELHFDEKGVCMACKFTTYYQSTVGAAIRPFLKHRLSIGVDINSENNVDSLHISPHTLTQFLACAV